MTAPATDDLRYPIGKLERQPSYSAAERSALIERLAAQPAALRAEVAALGDERLDTEYRPGGWTVRQLVHHVADSHMQAYTRVKLAITEDNPTVKPYDQDAWVKLADISAVPPGVSLALVDGVHLRMVTVLRSLEESDFRRTLMHPENGSMTVDDVIATYAWHGDHHIAHVRALRERIGG